MSNVVTIGKVFFRISADDSKVIEFSTDGGQNWFSQQQKGKPLEFVALASKGRSLIAETTSGKRYSDNGAKSWYGIVLRILKVFFKALGSSLKYYNAKTKKYT
ncbi:MAG: hypothetical protein LBT00_05230 [Spirochaetaceae bacterium]|jgi:hypothetical protein|nr:hypothetical protein [Spirochaetaceae bacterium]